MVLDSAEMERWALAALIESRLAKEGGHAGVVRRAPEDVFRRLLPGDMAAAFITVNSMADVEVTRQFAKLYKATPFVV